MKPGAKIVTPEDPTSVITKRVTTSKTDTTEGKPALTARAIAIARIPEATTTIATVTPEETSGDGTEIVNETIIGLETTVGPIFAEMIPWNASDRAKMFERQIFTRTKPIKLRATESEFEGARKTASGPI